MRRTAIFSLAMVVLAAVCVAGVSSAAMKHDGKVGIKLGAVPNVKTAATGGATFVLGKDGESIDYKLHVKNLENATMAHVHQVGDDGTPAAILVWIYPTTGEAPTLKEGKFSGTLAEGTLTADKLAGPMKGKPVKEVFEMLASGKAGVAVHTKQNAGGELWGVVKHKGMGKTHKGMDKTK